MVGKGWPRRPEPVPVPPEGRTTSIFMLNAIICVCLGLTVRNWTDSSICPRRRPIDKGQAEEGEREREKTKIMRIGEEERAETT